jgi:AcrR family transcriptional regulator
MSRVKRAQNGSASTKAKPGRGRPAVYSRDEILHAAKLAFSQHGYANVTLDQLAARLNTGKGTIYYHSSRKVDLLITISRDIIGASVPELRRIYALKASADIRFVMAMRSHMNEVLSDQQATKIYFENEADLPPPIRTELRNVLREIEKIFCQILSEGAQEGIFRCDSKMATRHLMAVAIWPYRWYSPNGRLSKEEFIDTAVDFALSSLKAGSTIHSVTNQVEPRRPSRSRAKKIRN